MKKVITSSIIIILLFLVSVTRVSAETEVTLNNINEHYLNDIDFSYNDLDLTQNEINVIEKYQDEELKLGLYEIDSYYQEYEGNVFGNNYYIYKQLEEVFKLNITIQSDSFAKIMDDYNNEMYDIVPGLIITEDREDSFYFSDFVDKANVFLYSNEYIQMNNIYDLDGKVIAKQEGMKIIVDEFIQYLESIDVYVTLVDYSNINDAIPHLGTEVDYIVHSKNVDLIQSGLNFIDAKQLFNTNDLHITSLREEDLMVLIDVFDKAYEYGLKDNLNEYSKELSYILFKEGIYFTEEEKDFINQTINDPIEVGSASNWIPYLYTNSDGELTGYAFDTFFTLTNNIGLNYEFQFDSNDSWNDVLNNLGRNSNEIMYDVITADSVTNYEEDFITYSQPIKSEEAYVVGLADSPLINSVFELRGFKVGIIPYYAATTYLEHNIGLTEFVEYQSLEDIIQGLNEGEIDYFVVVKSEYEGMYYVDKHYNILPKYTIKDDFDIAIGFPMDGEDTAILKSLYNKAIVLSDRSSVSDEYFNIQTDLNTVVLKRTMNLIFISIAILVSVVSGLVFFYIKKIQGILLFDSLTKTRNRRALFDRTDLQKYDFMYFIDLDNFKDINDKYGHKIGDEILIEFCKLVQEKLTSELFRLGGDEFILLSLEEYTKESFEIPDISIKGIDEKIKITMSVGAVKISKYTDLKIDELVNLSDMTMYKVKNGGKNDIGYISEDIVDKYITDMHKYRSRTENRD